MNRPTVTFTSDNYLAISVKEPEDAADPVKLSNFTIDFGKCTTPEKLAEQLRQAAAFAEAHLGDDLVIEID